MFCGLLLCLLSFLVYLYLGLHSCIFGLENGSIICWLIVACLILYVRSFLPYRFWLFVYIISVAEHTLLISYLLVQDVIQMFLHRNLRWVRVWVFFLEGLTKSSTKRWVELLLRINLSLHDLSNQGCEEYCMQWYCLLIHWIHMFTTLCGKG